MFIPEQHPKLQHFSSGFPQISESSDFPKHCMPPKSGFGLLQVLVLFRTPRPHFREQFDQLLHSEKSPCTTEKRIFK